MLAQYSLSILAISAGFSPESGGISCEADRQIFLLYNLVHIYGPECVLGRTYKHQVICREHIVIIRSEESGHSVLYRRLHKYWRDNRSKSFLHKFLHDELH